MAEAAAHTTLAFGGNALVSDAPLLDEMIGGIARPLGWALRSIGGTTRSMACVNWINVGVVHANLTRLPLPSQTKKYPNSCVQARRPPLLPPLLSSIHPNTHARAPQPSHRPQQHAVRTTKTRAAGSVTTATAIGTGPPDCAGPSLPSASRPSTTSSSPVAMGAAAAAADAAAEGRWWVRCVQ